MRKIWTILVLLLPLQAFAIPIVPDGYHVELYASGMGAITGVTLGADGNLYVADYQGGRILRVTDTNSYQVYSSGLSFITDLAFTDDGRLFAASSTSGNSAILEIAGDGSASAFSTGYSYPTSIESWGDSLFVTNSGDGTISRLDMSGTSSPFLTGLSAPHGPFGLSIDDAGMLYFVDHGSGVVYSADQFGNLQELGKVSPFGGTFTETGFDDTLFITDVNAGAIYSLDGTGLTLFASGFEGKSSPPAIGPNDMVYDGVNSLYVGDGDFIWRISRAVPEPASIVLFGLGLIVMGFAGRVKN